MLVVGHICVRLFDLFGRVLVCASVIRCFRVESVVRSCVGRACVSGRVFGCV